MRQCFSRHYRSRLNMRCTLAVAVVLGLSPCSCRMTISRRFAPAKPCPAVLLRVVSLLGLLPLGLFSTHKVKVGNTLPRVFRLLGFQ